jgi:hypothetical protein
MSFNNCTSSSPTTQPRPSNPLLRLQFADRLDRVPNRPQGGQTLVDWLDQVFEAAAHGGRLLRDQTIDEGEMYFRPTAAGPLYPITSTRRLRAVLPYVAAFRYLRGDMKWVPGRVPDLLLRQILKCPRRFTRLPGFSPAEFWGWYWLSRVEDRPFEDGSLSRYWAPRRGLKSPPKRHSRFERFLVSLEAGVDARR